MIRRTYAHLISANSTVNTATRRAQLPGVKPGAKLCQHCNRPVSHHYGGGTNRMIDRWCPTPSGRYTTTAFLAKEPTNGR